MEKEQERKRAIAARAKMKDELKQELQQERESEKT